MAHFPPIVPSIAVSDPRATIGWFEKLGFSSRGEATTPDGTIVHAEVVKGEAVIMLGPNMMGGLGSAGMSLYMTQENGIDDFYASVKAQGITMAEEIQDQFWGDRTFMVEHPDGYKIMFAQPVREVSMEEMQEAINSYAAAGAPA
jgi:PhnB protein